MRVTRSVVCVLVSLMCILVLGAVTGCQKAYYDALEAVGFEKREMLVDRSEELRDTLHLVKTEFGVAFSRLGTIVQPDALAPDQQYEQAQVLYDSCEDRYDELRKGIEKTEDVANALFEDWIEQTTQHPEGSMRAASQKRLDETREAFRTMMRPVRSASDRVPPVLSALEQHVMHLKLNQSPQASENVIAELDRSQTDLQALLDHAQTAIDATNGFIHSMSRQVHKQRTEPQEQ
ncbi:DUF2959 domain-containing protein [Desulfovibrio mangrovi]|uniref:DUF2959 family protein n=1 Tax=Desulfovibrio mangrovi TaxID=2976983 RepID=UPI002245F0FA|nr:DUF2959 family protein [Desulfovibrio mangrovi]UZP66610.1 DUF2959 domain-containing protein [Desulfovibrio mangrovi]